MDHFFRTSENIFNAFNDFGAPSLPLDDWHFFFDFSSFSAKWMGLMAQLVDSLIRFLLWLHTTLSSLLAPDKNHKIICVRFLRWLHWKWSIVIEWLEWVVNVQGLDRLNSVRIFRVKIDIDRSKKKVMQSGVNHIWCTLPRLPTFSISSAEGKEIDLLQQFFLLIRFIREQRANERKSFVDRKYSIFPAILIFIIYYFRCRLDGNETRTPNNAFWA